METHQQRLRLRLSSPAFDVLSLEPWGDEFPVHALSDFLVVFDGPANGIPTVEMVGSRCIVEGWSGSTVKLFVNGEEARSSGHIRVPDSN